MAIIGGGAKQDEAPVGHTAATPRHYKVNMWRDHGRQVQLAVAVTATARQLDEPCESLAVPQKMKKNENQNFMGVSISK